MNSEQTRIITQALYALSDQLKEVTRRLEELVKSVTAPKGGKPVKEETEL